MLRVGRSSSSATCWASLGMAGKRGWVRGKGHSGLTSVTLPFPASSSSDGLLEKTDREDFGQSGRYWGRANSTETISATQQITQIRPRSVGEASGICAGAAAVPRRSVK